ncbi:MAG: hypothetical protein ACJAZ8_001129 [Planctomycetota bacterium]|jgi:hypothetical protein
MDFSQEMADRGWICAKAYLSLEIHKGSEPGRALTFFFRIHEASSARSSHVKIERSSHDHPPTP